MASNFVIPKRSKVQQRATPSGEASRPEQQLSTTSNSSSSNEDLEPANLEDGQLPSDVPAEHLVLSPDEEELIRRARRTNNQLVHGVSTLNLVTAAPVAPANNNVNPMVHTANGIQAVAPVAPANIMLAPPQQFTITTAVTEKFQLNELTLQSIRNYEGFSQSL